MKLRAYQHEAHAAVIDAMIDGYKRILYTAPTGSGKTITFAAIINTLVRTYKWRVLVLANRQELIGQAYRHTKKNCGLDEYEIDVEMGSDHFNPSALVVVGSVQTCYRDNRLRGWYPQAIIADEAHFAAAETWQKLFARYPEAVVIGCTATALRGDKQQLYALSAVRPSVGTPYVETEDGDFRMMVFDKETKKERPIELSEAVFDKLVSVYEILDGIDDGYLVQLQKAVVRSSLDLSNVKVRRNKDGDVDYSAKDVAAVLEKDRDTMVDRINLAISMWKKEASDRPTIVFAPSVAYAQLAAELWWKAGYASQAIDAETEQHAYDPEFPWIPGGPAARDIALENVRLGKIQVTVNVAIYTHGTDVDVWSCVLLLKPTCSWPLYCQQAGRGTRPLKHIADQISNIDDAGERRKIIARSGKPDVLIIDVIDKNTRNNPCSAPAILGLPCDFDFEDHAMTEVKKMLNEREEEGTARVLAKSPLTFTELKFQLERIDLMKRAKARSVGHWRVSDRGYSYVNTPPGFHGESVAENGRWQTVAYHKGKEIGRKPGPVIDDRTQSLKAYQDVAARQIAEMIATHAHVVPARSRGTLAKLSDKQLYHLRAAKFSDEAIDGMGMDKARAIVAQQSKKYWAVKNGTQPGA